MSQQINLYNPALRRRRELLSANYLAVALVLALAGVIGGSVYGRQVADRAEARARAVEAELQADQTRLTVAAKAAAEHKPDPALVRELTQAKDLVQAKSEVLATLESGRIGTTEGFSDYLRGFARQSMDGLWLTGFEIGPGGQEMEIRGRMVNQSLLPRYIQRLDSEPRFRGRRFAALEMRGVDDSEKDLNKSDANKPLGLPASGSGKAEPPAGPVKYVEFVLRSSEKVNPEVRP